MAGMDFPDSGTIVGRADGFRLGFVEGWAWRPQRPHDKVVVELLVDGEVVAEAAACLFRADLSTAGIGLGQHAFSIPFAIEPNAAPQLHLTVRAKDGGVLTDGDFLVETLEDCGERARRRSLQHLEQVFGAFTSSPVSRAPEPPARTRPVNFIVHAARANTALASTLGLPDYSYMFVMRGYREVLRRLGTVHSVRDTGEVDAIYDTCWARGESCIFLSFAPPQSTPLGLRCPTIPVIAWEYGTIPTGGWPGDPREDWRLVLRQVGRAITISDFAARAIRAEMGALFPVAFVPTPVWDRLSGLRAGSAASHAPLDGRQLTLRPDGHVWDSRAETWSPTMPMPGVPAIRPRPAIAALPMRGAQLALAVASQQAQAQARTEALAREAAARLEQERETREQEAARLAAPPPTRAGAVRVTAFLAHQWYREVVRDALPRPAAALVSQAGRLATSLRGRPAEPEGTAQPPPPVETPTVESQPLQSAEPASLSEAEPDFPPPAEPPVIARSVPVGGTSPPAEPVLLPSHLPALEERPLPEPVLAEFRPDPYPAEPEPEPVGQQIYIGGTLFTAVLSPKDGRKNWQDIMTAFVMAFAETPDATLLIKIIGDDPTYWWWEINRLAKALPTFACRVVAISGYLPDEDYHKLIAATHVVVNASLAEGQCLPLVEFMSAGRPAIAPLHTAMLDYVTPANTFIVRSDVEFCSWPHDPRNHLQTTRHRIEWPSLRDAFRDAWRVVHDDPARYEAMAQAAAASVADYCSDAAVARVLASFLGLGDEVLTRCGWPALPRPAAEPALDPMQAERLLERAASFEPAGKQL